MSEAASSTEAQRIAAAQAYVDALVYHDASKVPVRPRVHPYRVGPQDGFSGDHLRRTFE